MMLDDIFKRFTDRMGRALSQFREEAATIRTGRPSPALIEDVAVECYGTKMSLKEIATILVQPPNMLVVQPWDKTNLQPIERALMKADIGAAPVVDGDAVRIALPPLTQDRRTELVRLLKSKAEEARIAFRLERDEARKAIAQLAADKKISEDEKFKAQERLQKEFDAFQKKLDEAVEARRQEIMSV